MWVRFLLPEPFIPSSFNGRTIGSDPINASSILALGTIKMSRTHKKPYTKSKRFDSSCRNHGSCPACESKRTHKNRKRARVAWEKLVDFLRGNADN